MPCLLITVLMLGLYFFNFHSLLTLDNLRAKHQMITNYVTQHPYLTPILFILTYTVSVCLIIPDSTILTLFAGIVFPWPLALAYCLFSETVGAVLFFGATRLLSTTAMEPKDSLIGKLHRSFQENSVSYLLFLRLSHIIPFWLINFCAGYFRASWGTFIWTTVVGVLPLNCFLIEAGHNLATTFAIGAPFTISSLFTLQTKLALLLMGLTALLPILYKKWKNRQI